MSDLSAFLNEQMNNPEFAQEYNAVQPEMDAIRSMIKARKSQNLTQKQLAELVGIDQGDISKLENGLRSLMNFTLIMCTDPRSSPKR